MPPPIPDMVRAIADAARPRRIVLFGSHARGQGDERSDVDLLIVEDGPFRDEGERADEMVRLWQELSPFRTPTDLLVFTEAEVEKWGATTNHIVAQALREGVVVYERP